MKRYIKKVNFEPIQKMSVELPCAVIITSINRWSLCGGTACVLSLGAVQAQGADYSIKPSLSVSEEYTDNVFESNLNKRSDYITRIQPGVLLNYKAPFWDWDLGYTFDYRYYARGSRGDEITHNGNLRGLLKLVDEKLFLELNDSYKRVSLDITRDNTSESLYQNQSDQNVGTVSPYLVLRPTAAIMLKTGYRYINTWYKDPQAVSKQDHVGFLDASYEVTSRFFATAGYTFTREESEQADNNHSRHEAYLGPRYEYADKSFVFAQGGVIITDYDNRPKAVNPSWSAGVTHSFDTMTATLSTAVKYSDDPRGSSTLDTSYNFLLAKTMKRGMISLQCSYTEFSDTTTEKLKTKRYSGGFTSNYEIIDNLQATLGLTYENYVDALNNTDTHKYFVDSGLFYTFGKDISLGLTYKYIDYSSAKVFEDNKQINRLILEVKKSF